MNTEELPQTVGAEDWSRLMREGRDLLTHLLDIEVPVISAINGPVYIHSELPVLGDIVLAAETAEFADLTHVVYGVVPGDSVHVIWPMLLGPNRVRYFLLTGQRLSAAQALEWGVVSEVLPKEKLLARAWELATELEKKPVVALRNTRLALTQQIKKRLLDELGYGLALEGMAILGGRAP
jgi:enoyl-CoA hydratase/carnithine racemase